MSSSIATMKPIRVWLAPPGPNPWKVLFVLEELGLPYEVKSLKFEDCKRKPYTDLNPNGRFPTIQDLNNDLILWETGAIIQYLIRQYDSEKRLISYDSLVEQSLCQQWLMFQVSGQGPYYGQAGWFRNYHHENLPSAYERYVNEIRRILGVLESVLTAKPERQWLVGDKMTFADMSFVSWNSHLNNLFTGVPEEDTLNGFPAVKAWHQRMAERPSWKKIMATRAVLMDEQGLQWNGMPKDSTVTFTEFEAAIAEETKRLAEAEKKTVEA